jgi:hypothetical protein
LSIKSKRRDNTSSPPIGYATGILKQVTGTSSPFFPTSPHLINLSPHLTPKYTITTLSTNQPICKRHGANGSQNKLIISDGFTSYKTSSIYLKDFILKITFLRVPNIHLTTVLNTYKC